MIPAQNAKTMEAFNNSIKSFSDGFKAYAKKADQAGGAAIMRAHEALPGVAKEARQTAGLTSDQMVDTLSGGAPWMKAMGDAGVGMTKAFLGVDEEKEDDSVKINPNEGAGENLAELDHLKRISENIVKLTGLVDRIEMSVRDANKITKAEGKRAQRNAARNRAAALEAQREGGLGEDGDEALGGEGGADAGGGGILSSLGSVFGSIPGFDAIKGLFAGGLKGITKIFGKLFWPVTAVIGIISFVTGFMDGYKEGGLQEGITQGFEGLINNLIDVPLNFLKDTVAFIAGMLGFEEFEKQLNDMGEVDISSMVRPIVEWFASIPDKIKQLMISIADSLPTILGFDMGAKMLDLLGIKKEEGGEEGAADSAAAESTTPTGSPPIHTRESVSAENARLKKLTPEQRKQEKITRAKSKLTKLQDASLYTRGLIQAEERALIDDPGNPFHEEILQQERDMQESLHNSIEMQKSILARLTGEDPRTGAANAMQDAGINKGSGGGGVVVSVDNSTTDQSSSQAASNILPMVMTTDNDSNMGQTFFIGDI